MKVMGRIALDFGRAPRSVIANLSGVAQEGGRLWTVSDEGRTLERLDPRGGGFRLAKRYALDDLIDGIPGAADGDELDLESLAFANGRLWLCGSHCNVRRKPDTKDVLNPEIRKRKSRRLFAGIKVTDGEPGKARHLPFSGDGSLRSHLRDDPYLAPFIDLPSKENGLDIEALAVRGGKAFLGLRGPVLDGIAVIIEVAIDKDMRLAEHRLHLLDLAGLGVRDLATDGEDMLVLAGPVGDSGGPFQLRRWTPRRTAKTQACDMVFPFPPGIEKPEAICPGVFGGLTGVLCLHDSPEGDRVSGKVYQADVIG